MNIPEQSDTLSPRDPERLGRLIPQLEAILAEVEGHDENIDRAKIGEVVEKLVAMNVGIHPTGEPTEDYRPATMEFLAGDIRRAIRDMKGGLPEKR